MRPQPLRLVGCVLAGLISALPAAQAQDKAASGARQPAATPLWLYAPVNFQVKEDTDRLIALLTRANAAGYSAAVITTQTAAAIRWFSSGVIVVQ